MINTYSSGLQRKNSIICDCRLLDVMRKASPLKFMVCMAHTGNRADAAVKVTIQIPELEVEGGGGRWG